MNNLYPWFTHAKNIQDGSCLWSRMNNRNNLVIAAAPSADRSQLDPLKVTGASSSAAARVAPASCGILAVLAVWWDVEPLRPGLIRAAG